MSYLIGQSPSPDDLVADGVGGVEMERNPRKTPV
jgi:hypothetical protein